MSHDYNQSAENQFADIAAIARQHPSLQQSGVRGSALILTVADDLSVNSETLARLCPP